MLHDSFTRCLLWGASPTLLAGALPIAPQTLLSAHANMPPNIFRYCYGVQRLHSRGFQHNFRNRKLVLACQITRATSTLENPPEGHPPQKPAWPPPDPPSQETHNLRSNASPASYLGTAKRLPEFNLTDKVVLVSGAARGLGLTQAEALLEAGATVYALDRLPEPSPDFYRVQRRAAEELGNTFHYRQIDVRNVGGLNDIIEKIGSERGRLDGLIAAAGIQQETPALEYTAEDANTMFEVNITGVFMTAQAVAKQMIRFGNGGSIAFIASMSAHAANRVLLVSCQVAARI